MTPARRNKQLQKTLSMTCVNYNTVWGNKAANLEKIKSNIEKAAQQGNDLVVFGEMSLVGFECDEEGTRRGKPCDMHEELAETIPGPSTKEIAEMAAALDIYVVFGMAEREKDNPKIRHNATVLIGPEGFIGAYRKICLSPAPRYNEDLCCSPGKEVPVFETRFGLMGIQICRDFWYVPELSRILALKGARLIINTSASPNVPWRPDFIAHQTVCRAMENIVYAASADIVGKERVTTYAGGSVIAGPLGTQPVYARVSDNRADEFVSATLDFARLQNLRDTNNWQRDRQGKLIARELTNLQGCAD
ncbi:MAG: carbon-nitrogen hydrolase family protein [Dehalococcoidales bacterium]|nr:carbon-nitrogen hydrolase family protein [Dehalococcoidales bacterium]